MNLPADIVQSLRLQPWQHVKRQTLQRYLDEHGEPALRRQLREGEIRCEDCWAPPDAPHTTGCPSAPTVDEQPEQEELW